VGTRPLEEHLAAVAAGVAAASRVLEREADVGRAVRTDAVGERQPDVAVVPRHPGERRRVVVGDDARRREVVVVEVLAVGTLYLADAVRVGRLDGRLAVVAVQSDRGRGWRRRRTSATVSSA
jgi:hypothetical protein